MESSGIIYEQWAYFVDIVTSGSLRLGMMRSPACIKQEALCSPDVAAIFLSKIGFESV